MKQIETERERRKKKRVNEPSRRRRQSSLPGMSSRFNSVFSVNLFCAHTSNKNHGSRSRSLTFFILQVILPQRKKKNFKQSPHTAHTGIDNNNLPPHREFVISWVFYLMGWCSPTNVCDVAQFSISIFV